MGFGLLKQTPTSRQSSMCSSQLPRGEHQLPACEVESPRARDKLASAIAVARERFSECLERLMDEVPIEPGDLMELEKRLHQTVAQECLDPVIAALIQDLHEEQEVRLRATALEICRPHLSSQKTNQKVTVTLLGGSKQELSTRYCLARPPKKKRRGRPRKKKVRQKSRDSGLYPFLEVLGIRFRVSLAVAGEVARFVATGTIAQAVDSLSRRGICLGKKAVDRIARSVAQRGLEYRDWVEKQTRAGYRGKTAKGLRLAIGCDGGRTRLRYSKKRGRPRKSGRRSYDGEWKEPKVLVVYELDARGRKRRGGLCRYDASMLRCDEFFDLLAALLRQIGANEAKEWVILGDGADWIWNRVPKLVEALDFDEDKVTQVVDFYHTVQRLHKIADERKDWKKSDKNQWVAKMKKLLRKDKVEEVIAEKSMFKGRGARARRDLFNYFVDRADKMRYGTFRKRGIPLGSGAVESCVRRVINLRLKGNGIFWLPESAEAVLHIRSQLLCGRWDEFITEISVPKDLWSLTSSDPYKPNRDAAQARLERRRRLQPTMVQKTRSQAA